ncbi:hypothetical protein HY485_03260 [Candidatus Woesearchaeota archaeon]|nr:hypothetical protein [Candidatus Woesearchaeota archaeon]
MKTKIFVTPVVALLASRVVHAHCPLCTAGIMAVAGGATYFGVNKVVIALLVGAFGASTGLWVARSLKKEYFRFQKSVVVLSSFLLTVVPLLPFIYAIYPLQISFAGDYGSLLNRTYVLNASLLSSVFGAWIVAVAPWLSSRITNLRGSHLPFQGIGLTLLMLIATSIVIQVGL